MATLRRFGGTEGDLLSLQDPSASLDDLNEAVTRLEDLDRTGRRVLGGANPFTEGVGRELLQARAALRARETPSETPSETPGSFQRASEEKQRTRRVVKVADRFRHAAAETPVADEVKGETDQRRSRIESMMTSLAEGDQQLAAGMVAEYADTGRYNAPF